MFGTSVNLYNTDCYLLFGFHGLLFHTLCHLSHLIQHHEVKGYICRESNRMTVSDWAAKDVEALKLTGFFLNIYTSLVLFYTYFFCTRILQSATRQISVNPIQTHYHYMEMQLDMHRVSALLSIM